MEREPAGDDAVIVDRTSSLHLEQSQPPIYDRPIGLRLLCQDPDSGAEHYLVHYPAGLVAMRHRHTAAQTIVVLEGRLTVNDTTLAAGGYCHLPAGSPMVHAPAPGTSCLFVTIFDRPFDVEPV